MDEMIFKLRSGFLKKIVAKLLSSIIYTKLGYRVDISIDKLEFESINGETNVSASMDLKLPSAEFVKVANSIAKNADYIMKEG